MRTILRQPILIESKSGIRLIPEGTEISINNPEESDRSPNDPAKVMAYRQSFIDGLNKANVAILNVEKGSYLPATRTNPEEYFAPSVTYRVVIPIDMPVTNESDKSAFVEAMAAHETNPDTSIGDTSIEDFFNHPELHLKLRGAMDSTFWTDLALAKNGNNYQIVGELVSTPEGADEGHRRLGFDTDWMDLFFK